MTFCRSTDEQFQVEKRLHKNIFRKNCAVLPQKVYGMCFIARSTLFQYDLLVSLLQFISWQSVAAVLGVGAAAVLMLKQLQKNKDASR